MYKYICCLILSDESRDLIRETGFDDTQIDLSNRFDKHQSQSLLVNLLIRLENSNSIHTCTSGAPKPSHVLQAIGLNREEADSTIKTGLGRFTTEEEILTVVEMIPEAVIRI
jgi:cysteine sulfinate desulfinase/cysteine desulfurase-like protein